MWLTCFPSVPPDPLRPPPSREPFDPTFAPNRSVCNIIGSVVFSSRFDYDDERLLTITHLLHDSSQIVSSPWGEVRRPHYLGDREAGWGSNWPCLARPSSSDALGRYKVPPSHAHACSTVSAPTYTAPHPQPASWELAPQDPVPASLTTLTLTRTHPACSSKTPSGTTAFGARWTGCPGRSDAFSRTLGA